MPIRLSDLAADRRDTTIATALGPLKVTYRPNALTMADAAALANTTGTAAFELLLRQMEKLIVAWDLTGPIDGPDGAALVAADEPIPAKAEILQYVPSVVLNDVFTAIQNDRSPKAPTSPKTSNGLFGGSFD